MVILFGIDNYWGVTLIYFSNTGLLIPQLCSLWACSLSRHELFQFHQPVLRVCLTLAICS